MSSAHARPRCIVGCVFDQNKHGGRHLGFPPVRAIVFGLYCAYETYFDQLFSSGREDTSSDYELYVKNTMSIDGLVAVIASGSTYTTALLFLVFVTVFSIEFLTQVIEICKRKLLCKWVEFSLWIGVMVIILLFIYLLSTIFLNLLWTYINNATRFYDSYIMHMIFLTFMDIIVYNHN